MQRANSLEKALILEETGAGGKGNDKLRWLDGIADSVDMGLSRLQEAVKVREAWRALVRGVTTSQTQLRD